MLSSGCEENEELFHFQTVGTSTATIAEISVSNDEDDEELNPGDQLVITLYYVNPI